MDGDVKPAMGYIYEAMDRAKEQIKENFNGVESRYKPIWDKIDRRWDMQLHRPLHAAGYYLNPSLHFENFRAHHEVKGGLYEVIERMYDRPTMVKIHEQLVKFNESDGMFGISAAVLMRKKMQPAKWRENYGDKCPELQHLAIRVLSLTCSATGCERNWSTPRKGTVWSNKGPRNLNKVPNVSNKRKSQIVDLDDEDEDDEDDEGDDIGFHETTVVEDEDEDDHFNPED